MVLKRCARPAERLLWDACPGAGVRLVSARIRSAGARSRGNPSLTGTDRRQSVKSPAPPAASRLGSRDREGKRDPIYATHSASVHGMPEGCKINLLCLFFFSCYRNPCTYLPYTARLTVDKRAQARCPRVGRLAHQTSRRADEATERRPCKCSPLFLDGMLARLKMRPKERS